MTRTNSLRGTAALRYAAVGLTAALVLGGCSGPDADPGAEAAQSGTANPSPPTRSNTSSTNAASETASATPTASPTPAAYKPASEQGPAENVPLPVMPELAEEESKEGLEAFAEHWYALVNYGFETGDPSPIKAISGPDCEICLNFYRLLGNGFNEDDWIMGGQLTITSVHSNYVLTGEGKYQVLAQMRQDKTEYRGPESLLYGTDEGFNATTVQMMEATYSDGQWFATNVVTIAV